MSSTKAEHALFPQRETLDADDIAHGLKAALETQQEGARNGKRPFAAVLIGPDRRTVLLRQFSLSEVNHAESTICSSAAAQFKPEFLWQSTLFSTWEPCVMCTGTLYWSNIGTLVYAASEKALQVVIGPNNEENFTLDMPCRSVIASGQKDIRVVGPVNGSKTEGSVGDLDWESKVCEDAWIRYWQAQRGLSNTTWAIYSKEKLT